MKSLEEIKADFEHVSYDHRIDFIDSYDFNDDFIEYYRSFIIAASDIKYPLYLSELIDLARWLRIFEPKLYERYFMYLFQKRHYLVKLASLDYLLDARQFYTDAESEKKISQLLKTKLPRLVRNQAYLNLLALNSSNSRHYFEQLRKSLIATTDWRSIVRVLNMVASVPALTPYRLQLYNLVKDINDTKSFGEGVDQKLDQLKIALTNCN